MIKFIFFIFSHVVRSLNVKALLGNAKVEMSMKKYETIKDQGSISPMFLRAFFARVFCTRFLYECLFSSYVQKTRAKNARENVGEIDPWCQFHQYVYAQLL